MFLEKYLNDFYLGQVYDNYDDGYLYTLNEVNFSKIYILLQKYGFYFIDDIILNYLEIFTLEEREVESKILKLKEELGINFVYIIGNNMSYLSRIIDL